jgi:hypothetical protein
MLEVRALAPSAGAWRWRVALAVVRLAKLSY